MSNLANVYARQGKYSDAEAQYKQCLVKMKLVHGENHPDTLNTMNNLANAYYHQGKHSDAEVLFKQCLDKKKEVFGENHPSTLGTMNSLAVTTSKLQAQIEK